MAKENSPIQAKGIGRDAKRHDLDGTPGLSGSSLQYGDVAAMEQGQKQVQNTVDPGGQAPAGPARRAPLAPQQGMTAPDPIEMAKRRLGGSIKGGNAEAPIQKKDFQNWLPVLERLASSPTASGVLQSAYIDRLSAALSQPTGGSATVIRQREYDKRLREY